MSAEPKPQTRSIYAALRDAAEVTQSPPGGERVPPAETALAAAAESPEAGYWRREVERIDTMLQALWTGFIQAPVNGLPSELADYVGTHTNAMRLKLKLMGYSAAPPRSTRAQAIKAKPP